MLHILYGIVFAHVLASKFTNEISIEKDVGTFWLCIHSIMYTVFLLIVSLPIIFMLHIPSNEIIVDMWKWSMLNGVMYWIVSYLFSINSLRYKLIIEHLVHIVCLIVSFIYIVDI